MEPRCQLSLALCAHNAGIAQKLDQAVLDLHGLDDCLNLEDELQDAFLGTTREVPTAAHEVDVQRILVLPGPRNPCGDLKTVLMAD